MSLPPSTLLLSSSLQCVFSLLQSSAPYPRIFQFFPYDPHHTHTLCNMPPSSLFFSPLIPARPLKLPYQIQFFSSLSLAINSSLLCISSTSTIAIPHFSITTPPNFYPVSFSSSVPPYHSFPSSLSSPPPLPFIPSTCYSFLPLLYTHYITSQSIPSRIIPHPVSPFLLSLPTFHSFPCLHHSSLLPMPSSLLPLFLPILLYTCSCPSQSIPTPPSPCICSPGPPYHTLLPYLFLAVFTLFVTSPLHPVLCSLL